MPPEIALAAMKFMARVQLVGEEVPAFNAVMSELDRHARPGTQSKPDARDEQGARDGDGKTL